MADKVAISTFELQSLLADEAAARIYLEARRWPSGVCCPTCDSKERITARGGKREGYYRCGAGCGEFTVRTDSIFERSHLTLRQWVMTMYMLVTARRAVSSVQLSRNIGCTQKSAWFALQRLREACGDELDGSAVSKRSNSAGRAKDKYGIKKLRTLRGTVGKAAVLGVIECGVKLKSMQI